MNKKGIALPTVLGIIALLFLITGIVFVLVVDSATLVERNIEITEEQNLGMNKVLAAGELLKNEGNFDTVYLTELESYLNVSIVSISDSIWKISYEISNNRNIVSYLSLSSAQSVYDQIFQYTGTEDEFSLDSNITSENLLDGYLDDFLDQNYPQLIYPQTFESYDEIFNYIYSLTQTGEFVLKTPADLTSQSNPTSGFYWYIEGDVNMPNNKNLTVPEGQILFINGDLTMNRNSTLRGNVVVNGSFTTIGQGNSVETIIGTVYVRDTFTADRKLFLGENMTPGIILAQGDIFLGNNTSGYGYILGNLIDITGQGSLNLTGGIYVVNSEDIPTNRVFPAEDFDENFLYDYALPSSIVNEGTEGDGEMILTLPRLEN